MKARNEDNHMKNESFKSYTQCFIKEKIRVPNYDESVSVDAF